MIQRITLLNGIKAENEAISYYAKLIKIADNETDKKDFLHAQKEEKEHRAMLIKKLNKIVVRKGQTKIIN